MQDDEKIQDHEKMRTHVSFHGPAGAPRREPLQALVPTTAGRDAAARPGAISPDTDPRKGAGRPDLPLMRFACIDVKIRRNDTKLLIRFA